MTLQLDDIDDIGLKNDITTLVDEHKKAGPVIEKLINYYNLKLGGAGENANKRRKLTLQMDNADTELHEQLTKIPDLSFQLPARKKYTLAFTRSKLQLVNEKTQTVEHQMGVSDLAQVTCVPSPDKPAGSFTFALFSKHATLEPFVFTLADKGILTVVRMDSTLELTSPEDKKKALVDLLTSSPDQLGSPSRQFYTCSGVSPSTGKADTDRAFVKTYLRTKDGVLYFLPQGILFGFKKPTVFVPKTSIAATVITNVTKHTFDLGLQLCPDQLPLGAGTTSWAPFTDQQQSGTTTLLLPFSMIEQSDYAGIEGYIQKLGINDQSMTEATKAPEPNAKNQYNANDNDEDDNVEEETAIMDHMQDEEEDDDFNPGDNSDDDNPLEYDSDASVDEEQGDNDDDEVDLLDEDDDEGDDGA